jgi:sterol desaturase/sphingolipid hydroxylase (fatty acid hydroxylase superfamily)
VQVVFTFLGSEFGFYIFHRLEHENPILWRIHAVHHSAEKLNFFTSNRDHPVETILITFARIFGVGLFLGIVLYLGGLKLLPQTFFFASVYSVCIHGFYAGHSHSHLPISFGPVLNVLIGGPVMHQIHHSAEDHMFNRNYGMATNIYDWLFGTLYMPRAGEVYRWGLNDLEYGARNPHQTVQDFYLKPVLEAMATARTGFRNLLQRWI